jgi:FkbM family methyltransferase
MIDFYGVVLTSEPEEQQAGCKVGSGISLPAQILSDDISRFIEILRPRSSPFPLIRVGGSSDGAYLVPADLEGIAACFSPGVNNFKNFEDELSLNYGIACHMCDYTSDVDLLATPLHRPMQSFSKKWLAAEPDADSLTLPEWIGQHVSDRDTDLMLQMDIEGAEYGILLSLEREVLSRFRILVIEFHSLHRALADYRVLRDVCLPLFENISRDFVCIHAHPNNYLPFGHVIPGHSASLPELLELTFLRRDRFLGSRPFADRPVLIPHPLDVSNVPANPPFFLEAAWSGGRRHWRSRLKILQERLFYRLFQPSAD